MAYLNVNLASSVLKQPWFMDGFRADAVKGFPTLSKPMIVQPNSTFVPPPERAVIHGTDGFESSFVGDSLPFFCEALRKGVATPSKISMQRSLAGSERAQAVPFGTMILPAPARYMLSINESLLGPLSSQVPDVMLTSLRIARDQVLDDGGTNPLGYRMYNVRTGNFFDISGQSNPAHARGLHAVIGDSWVHEIPHFSKETHVEVGRSIPGVYNSQHQRIIRQNPERREDTEVLADGYDIQIVGEENIQAFLSGLRALGLEVPDDGSPMSMVFDLARAIYASGTYSDHPQEQITELGRSTYTTSGDIREVSVRSRERLPYHGTPPVGYALEVKYISTGTLTIGIRPAGHQQSTSAFPLRGAALQMFETANDLIDVLLAEKSAQHYLNLG